jgi:hypothetical protein
MDRNTIGDCENGFLLFFFGENHTPIPLSSEYGQSNVPRRDIDPPLDVIAFMVMNSGGLLHNVTQYLMLSTSTDIRCQHPL